MNENGNVITYVTKGIILSYFKILLITYFPYLKIRELSILFLASKLMIEIRTSICYSIFAI